MVRGGRPWSLSLLPFALWSGASHAQWSADGGLQRLALQASALLLGIAALLVFYSITALARQRARGGSDTGDGVRFGSWSWLLVPLLLLALPLTIANRQLSAAAGWAPGGSMVVEIKMVGDRTGWSYEITGEDVRGEARGGELRLLLPLGRKVRFLHIAEGEPLNFVVPQLDLIREAIPGYLSESWITPEHPGVFRSVCVTPCARQAPVVMEVVPGARFEAWLAERRAGGAR